MTRKPDSPKAPFAVDRRVEAVFHEMNEALVEVEERVAAGASGPLMGPIFITGTQRSGTTLLSQLISRAFRVGYVSNVMARFWAAPAVGAMLSEELRSKAPRQHVGYESSLGATYGAFEPHEFGYFWRRWLPFEDNHVLSLQELDPEKIQGLRREIVAIQDVFDAPVVFKTPAVTALNLEVMVKLFKSAVFLVCQRDPVEVIRSTLESRVRMHGSEQEWWSIRPRAYDTLMQEDPVWQVAGQVYYTRRSLDRGLAALSETQWLEVPYEAVCHDTHGQLARIEAFLSEAGLGVARAESDVPASFPVRGWGEARFGEHDLAEIWANTPRRSWPKDG